MFASSMLVKDIFFHTCSRSSIPIPKLFPNPHKETTLDLLITLLLEGTLATLLQRGRKLMKINEYEDELGYI